MPDVHLGLGGASKVANLRSRRIDNLLRSEVESGRLPVFHVLPEMPRVRFRDLANWYEGQEGKIPDCHRTNRPLDYRTRPLSESRQTFAHQCVAHAFKIGLLERGHCLYCGAEAEGHHPDYNKPLWLVWLCTYHHRIQHARLSAAKTQLKQTGSPSQLDLFPARWFSSAVSGSSISFEAHNSSSVDKSAAS
jgi:hypothetical protein